MGARTWLAICAGLLILAVLFSYPLVFYFRSGMPYSFMPVPELELQRQYPGDYIQLLYRFWLFGQAFSGKTPFFSNAYEFSTPLTPPMFTTQGIPLSCIFLIFTPWGTIFAYNVLIILSFLAAGIAMALLVYEVTRSRNAAAACGFLYSCIPFRMGHLFGGHAGGFAYFLMPLMVYFLERSWREISEQTPGWRGRSGGWGFAVGLCALCTAIVELQLVFYMGLLVVLYIGCRCIEIWARNGLRTAVRSAWLPVAGMAIPAAIAAVYVLWVKMHILNTSIMGEGRPLGTVQMYSPMLRDIFSKNSNAEKNIYLGFLPLAGAIYGALMRRKEIRRGRAETGALLWFYFWGLLFALCYLLSLGTTLERYLPLYSFLHSRIPFFSYTRTSSRILCLVLMPFFLFLAYGVRDLLSRRRPVRVAAWLLLLIALFDYHPKSSIGISTLGGIDSVYGEVRRAARGKRLLEIPLWPGDSALSTIYEYYTTLTAVPIVNGYNPAPRHAYIKKVFEPLRSINYGEMRRGQYDLLQQWDVPCMVLHQDLFPRKVSRYPFRFTLLNLMRSPYLELRSQEGGHYLFWLRDKPAGQDPEFTLTSPVGNLYSARRMESDVSVRTQDKSASSGFALSAGEHGEKSGLLARSDARIYPTGKFKVFFHLKSRSSGVTGPVARIEVFAPDEDKVIAEQDLIPGDFGGSGGYGLFELAFENIRPRSVEFRVHYPGMGVLSYDFNYIIFAGESDPRRLYKAEDLFHIGACVDDPAAPGGGVVEIGKNEDLTMPMISGPDRLYKKGRYRARFYFRTDEAEAGTVAKIEVGSTFGEVIAQREVANVELKDPGRYHASDISFELDRITPLSFRVRHYNRASLRLDKIEVEELKGP
ncbi:MAG: hypothetical protein NTZ78_03175 [Candidatus Aureabacteria bacterium]|nr:hypothetical protein [Candidatus Auribacterota bacterium]